MFVVIYCTYITLYHIRDSHSTRLRFVAPGCTCVYVLIKSTICSLMVLVLLYCLCTCTRQQNIRLSSIYSIYWCTKNHPLTINYLLKPSPCTDCDILFRVLIIVFLSHSRPPTTVSRDLERHVPLTTFRQGKPNQSVSVSDTTFWGFYSPKCVQKCSFLPYKNSLLLIFINYCLVYDFSQLQ